MKWFLHGIAWILLIIMIVMAPILAERLPNTSEGMAAKTYERWAGVLRIWVACDWQPGSGSLTPWLNTNLSRFERKNQGVYVQVQTVSEQLLKSFASGEINPPDALIFSPGLLTSIKNILPLDVHPELLPSLYDVGVVQDDSYAAPIAMGGYAWAINTKLISGAPVGEIVLPAPSKKGDPIYLIQAPADDSGHSWSSALLSLCLHASKSDLVEPTPAPAGDGIDLGLDVPESDLAEAEPEAQIPEAELVLSLPDVLPEDFRQTESAIGDFVAGSAAAIPITQQEIRRLEQLADNGRAPDYLIVPGAKSFSDQLAMFAIVDYPRSDAAARQALCAALLELLLDETSQQGLQSVRALKVTDGAAIYSGHRNMAALERGYIADFSCPNAFDTGFRLNAQRRLDAALAQP